MGLVFLISTRLPTLPPLPWFCITIAICEWKLAWSWSGQNKCSLISMVQRQEPLHTNIHTQRQRLERRLCLGFLLLERRFMVGESCRESLRLNYTDGEHQIQEKLPRLWGEWWGSDESGIERERYRSGVWERCITPNPSPSTPLRLVVLRRTTKQGVKRQYKSYECGSSQEDLREYLKAQTPSCGWEVIVAVS